MKLYKSSDDTIRIEYDAGYASVIIPTKNDKIAVCVSSQIGCPIKCSFCYSKKFERNLSCEEIVEQVRTSKKISGHINSVVFMGTGEPMLNYKEVIRAIETIHKEFDIPYRRITLSTIGIDLDKLVDARFSVAVSLHSPFDHIRKSLIPKGCSVEDIVNFSQDIKSKDGLMIEYALIEDVNDGDHELNMLLSLDWSENTNFNLIEFNDKGEFHASERLFHFKEKIRKAGFKCFIRESRGKDIGAACGMLSF